MESTTNIRAAGLKELKHFGKLTASLRVATITVMGNFAWTEPVASFERDSTDIAGVIELTGLLVPGTFAARQ
jgi:hypothetical protein